MAVIYYKYCDSFIVMDAMMMDDGHDMPRGTPSFTTIHASHKKYIFSLWRSMASPLLWKLFCV